MALLNFHSSLAPLVESRQKRQTIRAQRKRPVEIGEMLHLYTGCRTKAARRLIEPQVCLLAVPIRMRWKYGRYRSFECVINGRKLTVSEIQNLALKDGFPNTAAFKGFFLPDGVSEFIGQFITW